MSTVSIDTSTIRRGDTTAKYRQKACSMLDLGGGGDACTNDPLAPCEWALSHDAVFVGRVTDIRLSFEPMVIKDGKTWVVTTDSSRCSSIDGVLEVDMEVARSFGTLLEEKVTVLIGPSDYQAWEPIPEISEEGEVTWTNRGFDPTKTDGFYIGQTLGFPITFLQDAAPAVSSLEDPPFTVIAGPKGELLVSIPNGDPVCGQRPVALEGLTLDQFFAELESCTLPNAAAEERARMWGFQEPHVLEYSAHCLPYYKPDPPPCAVDSDCAAGEVCHTPLGICAPLPFP